MVAKNRQLELEQIAENEIRQRGFNSGAAYLQKTYHLYDLTDAEARAVSYLIYNSKVALPAFPHHLV